MMTMGPGQGINPGSMAGAMAGGMAQQMQKGKMAGAGMPGAGGAGPGGPAQAGGAGGSPADSGPADFNSPEGAVRSFLNALKAKDLDRLNESTALRASVPHEGGSAKNQELFKKIIDLSLSDSELDDLAKKLEGFAVEFDNPQTSTGRIDVVIRKATEHGGYIRRKVTTRREKKGWGVLDIGPSQTFKTPGLILPRKSSGGRR